MWTRYSATVQHAIFVQKSINCIFSKGPALTKTYFLVCFWTPGEAQPHLPIVSGTAVGEEDDRETE